jgi:DNA helicase-2/ATP-dependent DNA helicase PcrA
MRDLRRASQELNVAQLIDHMLVHMGYLDFLRDGTPDGETRLENVRELITVADEFSAEGPVGSLASFLEDAALAADADEYDASADAVTLITLHAAKGLEFGVVFIVGMEEGMCPHSRSVDDPYQLEEERRLLYVGITRARRRLFLTYTAHRSQFGDAAMRQPSRYFKDLPKELLQGTATAVQGRRREWTAGSREAAGIGSPLGGDGRGGPSTGRPTPSFEKVRPGQRVAHPKFGEGVVVSVEARGEDQEVTVAFPEVGVKRLLASYANLKGTQG